jgi:hypothetical protein
MPLRPGQQPGAEQRRRDGGGLHRDAALGQAEGIGGDDAEAGDLGDREIDEDDAAVEHLLAERHVRRQHQQAGDQGRAEDAPVERAPVHVFGAAPASSRATVSSKRPNRSLAPSVPPTVNGTLTTAMPAFLPSQSDGRESW